MNWEVDSMWTVLEDMVGYLMNWEGCNEVTKFFKDVACRGSRN